MIATRTTEPTIEPVSLDEAKDHLRVTFNDHDSQIYNWIVAGRQFAEAYTRRALVQQTWTLYFNGWPRGADYFELPFPPLQSVTSIKYTDSEDDTTTWSTDEYEVDTDSEPGRVVLAYDYTWPSFTPHPKNPIEIIYVAGYDDDGGSPADYRANIPQSIKNAILLHVEILYNRTDANYTKLLADARDSLLNPYRVWTF